MSENLNQTEPEASPAENLSPEVSWVRTFLGRITTILRDADNQKAKLVGPARLVLTVLDSSARVYLFKNEYEQLAAWKAANDKLRQIHLNHGNDKADVAFFKQMASLHEKASDPDFDHSQILTRDQFREKFQAIRLSASEEQKRLWRENISLCRTLSARVIPIILEQAESLETSEKERYENFGLPYTGSPFAAACRAAAKFIEARVALSESTGGPNDCLPWLLL